MDKSPRQRFVTWTRLLLFGVIAGCASLDDTEPAAAGSASELDTMRAADAAAMLAITEQGIVRGTASATMRAFLGIPYAAAPVGDLRWRPPEPPAHHTRVLDATRFGARCPQPIPVPDQAEDCLFLNVFTPAAPARRPRPVMVWIHGGALVAGASNEFDPGRMVVRGDVVAVTINYRLGELGFLAHPALRAEPPDHAAGNYGLLDQQEALRWVRRNIAFFGGDPERVTIFGESAGGLSVHAQLASPRSRGLFQRAIVQSGAYQPTQPTLEAAEAEGRTFAAAAGCADQSAACLRARSVAEVLAAQRGASPTIDHKVLTQSATAAFARGEFNRVPVIEGATHDEMRQSILLRELITGPVTAAGYSDAIQSLGLPAQTVPRVIAAYPLADFPSPGLALAALYTDVVFSCTARRAAQDLAQFVPTFTYEFNDPNAPAIGLPPAPFPYGSSHGSELPYLFNLPVTGGSPTLDADQQQLADAMIDAWTTFARTGQPSAPGLPRWPRFLPTSDSFQELVPPRPASTEGFAADHRCAFWDTLPL